MTNPETYLRTPMLSESREARELRQYARTELNSGIGCLLSECSGNGGKRASPLVAKIRALFRAGRWPKSDISLPSTNSRSSEWLNFK